MKGSEKQIKWAEDIRKKAIENLDNAINIIRWIIRDDFDEANDWKDSRFDKWEKINKQLMRYIISDKDKENLDDKEWIEKYTKVVKNIEKMKSDIENEVGKWSDAKTFIDARDRLKDPVFLPSYVYLLKEYGFGENQSIEEKKSEQPSKKTSQRKTKNAGFGITP